MSVGNFAFVVGAIAGGAALLAILYIAWDEALRELRGWWPERRKRARGRR